MRPSPQNTRRPRHVLDAIATTIKSKHHSGTSKMTSSQMCDRGPTKASMPSTCTSPPWSTNTNSPTKTPRGHPKSWSCGMQYDTLRPGTGYASRTCCKMFQKAKKKGHAELTSLTTVTSSVSSSVSSIHQDALSTYPKCSQCGYYHPPVNCPADVAAIITLHPYAEQDPRDHPEEAKPSLLEMQAHHPDEDATSLAVGTRPATPSDSPPTGTVEHLLAVPPTAVPAAPAILTDRCNRRSTPFHNYQDSIKKVPVPSTTDSLET